MTELRSCDDVTADLPTASEAVNVRNAAGRLRTAVAPPAVQTELLDVNAVAVLLGISVRQVWNFRDAGKMPAPVKLNSSVRWRRTELDAWIAAGCPAVRPPKPRPDKRRRANRSRG